MTPTEAGDYRVMVHYFSDDGEGATNAWVEVFIDGARAGSFGPERLGGTGAEWTPCTINWPSGQVIGGRGR